jgi:hypothetical protein
MQSAWTGTRMAIRSFSVRRRWAVTGTLAIMGLALIAPVTQAMNPDTDITTGPAEGEVITIRSASFGFTSETADATFQCRLVDADFEDCESPKALTMLADGEHTFEVRAVKSGSQDPIPASRTFGVDATPPQTTITQKPPQLTNDDDPEFRFASSESGSTFECQIDGGGWTNCTSPQNTGELTDAQHEFEVRATDRHGNVDPTPASWTFRVDDTPPQVIMTNGPVSPTKVSAPTFHFVANETASFSCTVDNGTSTACTSPRTIDGVDDGLHTFEVAATDLAGNTGNPVMLQFRVDTTPPQTSITGGPTGLTNDSNPEFTLVSTEPVGATFACSIDDGTFAPCTTPHTTASLNDGPHFLHVRATDQAGNTDQSPASRAFTVAANPPQTTITTGPAATITDNTPTFEFSSSAAASTFQCRIDGAAFAVCNTPHTTPVLPDGPHTFEVRAIDVLGNLDPTPASRAFTVDAAPPPSAQPQSIKLRATSGKRAELAGLPRRGTALVEFVVKNATTKNLPPTRFKITRGSAKLSGKAPAGFAQGHWTTAVLAGRTATLTLRVKATKGGKVTFAIRPPAQPSLSSTYDIATGLATIRKVTRITRGSGPKTTVSGTLKAARCAGSVRLQAQAPGGSWRNAGVKGNLRVLKQTRPTSGGSAQSTICSWTATIKFASGVFTFRFVRVRAVVAGGSRSAPARVDVRR